MSNILNLSNTDGVAHLELNRPDKLNALSFDMFSALPDAVDTLAEDTSVRALILSGAGRGFCAGMDMANFANPQILADKFFANAPAAYPNFFQRPAWCLRQAPMPVIAAIHGPCLGGGLQIALAADIRLAAPDVQFSVMEIRWGMIPDMSGSQTLRDLVGLDVAKELAFTGRKIGAEEAKEMGLITRIAADPIAAAKELAAEIARKNPDAIRGIKTLFNEAWHGEGGLETEERIQKGIVFQPNQMEAAMAAFEKREPVFKD